eukprot:CAMPEP_0119055094 /NCGR_PEP_ID=MMETSP1177-20130426/75505_1 /TAXON_ID=2985 /ORGANISM="Ochromonas sp, Strain CCMP1899" /LENGTH=104 /DNA_ID=CAMNT_0007035545 /DNA_START=640 /DNA_END=951 /DNA_ORIENTATION=-
MPVMWMKDVSSDKGRSLSVFEEWLNDLLPSAAELEASANLESKSGSKSGKSKKNMSKDERKAMQAYKAMMQDINEDLNREIEGAEIISNETEKDSIIKEERKIS